MFHRIGRATGNSSLEQPELRAGDRTKLQAGMAFAVDGSYTVPGRFGAGPRHHPGDRGGAECVTESPRDQPVV